MTPVQTNRTSDASRAPRSINSSSADRRQRLHLRELCDEVLASYRVATGREPLSDVERREARAMLAGLTPRVSR
jgi:hypothetical protein